MTADGGSRCACVDDNDTDLFWAPRGGSGDCAVVAGMEFRLYPVDAFYAGAMFLGLDQGRRRAACVVRVDAAGARGGDHLARILKFPDLGPDPQAGVQAESRPPSSTGRSSVTRTTASIW